MQVERERIEFRPREKKFITLYIPPQNDVGTAEILLYVSDES